MSTAGRAVGDIIAIVGAVAAVICVVAVVMALPTMLIVNYVFSDAALVAVFGGPLTFWKAFWLNFLCGILFKSSSSSKDS